MIQNHVPCRKPLHCWTCTRSAFVVLLICAQFAQNANGGANVAQAERPDMDKIETGALRDGDTSKSVCSLVEKTFHYCSKAFLDDVASASIASPKTGLARVQRSVTNQVEISVMKDSAGCVRFVRVLKYLDAELTKEASSEGYEIYYDSAGRPLKIQRRDTKEVLTFHENGKPKSFLQEGVDGRWVDVKWNPSGSLISDERTTPQEALRVRR